MEDIYKELGFKQPKILVNPYGIKIYVGTKGEDDWCVVIPKELVRMKCSHYSIDQDYCLYLITEGEALAMAREYADLARKLKG